jgi:hypothetical protein
MTRFEDITKQGGPYFRAGHVGRGVAFGDLDNDGGIDLVISHTNEPVALLRNRVPQRGHWLGVALVGKLCRDPIGAKLTLEFGGRTLERWVLGGGSYLSSSDRRVVFGLGNSQSVDRLTINWPSGQVQVVSGHELKNDRYVTIREGEAVLAVR